MFVKLVVGDYSGDGHDKTQSFFYELSSPIDSLEEHYRKAALATGFDITQYFKEYEDRRIPVETAQMLVDRFGCSFIFEEDEDTVVVFPDEYADCYVAIFNSLDPKVKLTPLTIEDIINIGGYGLFS